MHKINIVLIVVWLIGAVYPLCPIKCQCSRKKWNCGGQGLTNEMLLEIAKNGDPSTAKELVLKKNNITDFPSHAFRAFTMLKVLDLGENHLTKVPKDLYGNIPSLEEMKLNQNNLRQLAKDDFVGYDNIELLDLYKNNIEHLEPNTFQSLSKLKKLFAESNNIKILRNGTLNGLSQVQELSFEGNDLEGIEAGVFYETPNLEMLWLSKNKLTSLPEGLFKNLTKLFMLDLEGNQFADDSFSNGIFKHLNLDDLKLNENKLTTLKKDWFGKVMVTLNLTSNPIVCDCNIYETYRILHPSGSANFEILGNCTNPDSFGNIPIQRHIKENLSNCTACSANECQNNANCTVFDVKSFTYNCTCPKQFFGQYCETEDFCVDVPCMNNGTCLNNLTSFDCQCESGYTGITCQLEQPCFFTNPCKNNGTCEYMGGTDYLCECHVGYEGKNCSKLTGKKVATKPEYYYIILIVLIILTVISVVGVAIYLRHRRKNAEALSRVEETSPLYTVK